MQFAKRFAAVSRTGLDTYAYAVLPYGQTETISEDKSPAAHTGEGWAEIREMLIDAATVKLANALEEKGIAAPEEAGYELANDSGEVVAEIELAWISRKVGYMTEEQASDREKAEHAGWVIFTTSNEMETIFGEG